MERFLFGREDLWPPSVSGTKMNTPYEGMCEIIIVFTWVFNPLAMERAPTVIYIADEVNYHAWKIHA